MITKVFISDLNLNASIGIHDFEKKQSQTIIVNIVLEIFRHDIEDELCTTICYETLVNRVTELVNSVHYNLAETLAYEIAKISFEDSRVKSVNVKITKPEIIKNAKVGAELFLTKDEFANHSFKKQ